MRPDTPCPPPLRLILTLFDFAFDFVRLLLKIGETLERDIQRAADFARADHIDIKRVEDFRMHRHGFGKGAAIFDGFSNSADHVLQSTILLLFLQNLEPAQQRHACIDQGCELTREHSQRARLYAPR